MNAYFIRLGPDDSWQPKALENGTLLLDYRETPQNLAEAGDWDGVRKSVNWSENTAATTNHIRQVRTFYEATKSDVFITLAVGVMCWCRPTGPVERLSDGTHQRGTIDGWHKTSINGTPMSTDRLSGHLLKVQMYQGTICEVPTDYVMRKINDEMSPEVERAITAQDELVQANAALLKLLTWQDFELLVELVFSSSGWRRTASVGSTLKTTDTEMILPSTSERAFVQVKSKAGNSDCRNYIDRFVQSNFDKMFFVWHTGVITEEQENVILVGPERLGRMVLDAGLSSWLRNKTF